MCDVDRTLAYDIERAGFCVRVVIISQNLRAQLSADRKLPGPSATFGGQPVLAIPSEQSWPLGQERGRYRLMMLPWMRVI